MNRDRSLSNESTSESLGGVSDENDESLSSKKNCWCCDIQPGPHRNCCGKFWALFFTYDSWLIETDITQHPRKLIGKETILHKKTLVEQKRCWTKKLSFSCLVYAYNQSVKMDEKNQKRMSPRRLSRRKRHQKHHHDQQPQQQSQQPSVNGNWRNASSNSATLSVTVHSHSQSQSQKPTTKWERK